VWVVFCVCRVGLMKLRPRVGCGPCVSCRFNEVASSCGLCCVCRVGLMKLRPRVGCGSCLSCRFNEVASSCGLWVVCVV